MFAAVDVDALLAGVLSGLVKYSPILFAGLLGIVLGAVHASEAREPVRVVGYIHLDARSRSGKGRVDSLAAARAKLTALHCQRLDGPSLDTATMTDVCAQVLANANVFEACTDVLVAGSHARCVADFRRDTPWTSTQRWTYVVLDDIDVK